MIGSRTLTNPLPHTADFGMNEENRIEIDQGNQGSASFWIVRDQWGHLVLIDEHSVKHSKVVPIPLFPISEPNRWISLVDSSGHELLLIEDLEQLPSGLKTIIREELSFHELVPRIANVISVSGATEPCEWVVDTDRGRTRFVLNSEDDIRRLSAHTVQIIDATGLRFRVDDTRKLDARSRRFIEWYV